MVKSPAPKAKSELSGTVKKSVVPSKTKDPTPTLLSTLDNAALPEAVRFLGTGDSSITAEPSVFRSKTVLS